MGMAKRAPRGAGQVRRRRSTRHDQSLELLQQHDGHISADELYDAVRSRYAGTGRATVYRALQRMVESGDARRVDFGEGRQRYEASRGAPRHFHLVCSSCHKSSEFFSSDVEVSLEEVAGARSFEPRQLVVQIFGTCDECLTGRKSATVEGLSTKRLFARDALRMAINTEKQGLAFYTRAASVTRDAAGRKVFVSLADEEKEHLSTLETRYRELIAEDPLLETLPTFLFFKGAASGLFAEGAEQLRRGVNGEEALQIGIDCERGSHRFFKRYGERFEDSEGKRIFLEFADEERAHLELLQGELDALRARQARKTTTRRSKPRRSGRRR